MRFSWVFLMRNPILSMTLGIPSAMWRSPRESPISTYLIFDEILLCVPVEEPNLEDDFGVGDPLRHVQVLQRVTPSVPTLYFMIFSWVFLFRYPILRMTWGLEIPSA
jgi:hypothetical protein